VHGAKACDPKLEVNVSDPLTIGSITALVLGMAGEASLKGVVGAAVKDAYKSLKDKIAQWASGDVDALERNPTSATRQAVIAEAVDGRSPEDQTAIQELTRALADALKTQDRDKPIGLDLDRLEAARVTLGTVNVRAGVGIRAKEVKTSGDFSIKELNVGGKAAQ
jgi:hypothetical protein